MESACFGPSSRWPTALFLFAAILASDAPSTNAIAANSGDTATAKRLVADALRAEIAGDAGHRTELLDKAIQAAPDYQPARWQSGQIEIDGKWLPLRDAQRAVASDPKHTEYLQRRASAGNDPDAQLSLARWCRKYGLADEAKLHWATVLANQPANEDAQRALGVRLFHGRLMTSEEIECAQREMKDTREAIKEYAPRIAQWQRELSAGDIASRDKALDEIRGIDDPRAIPAVENLTLVQRLSDNSQFERCLQVSQAFVTALNGMHSQSATKSLLRHAVFSPLKSIREAAIAALKERSPHDYIPLLLAGLSMPIESSFRVVTDDDGSVHYWHSLYREGRDCDWSFEGRYSAMQEDLQGTKYVLLLERPSNQVPVDAFEIRPKKDPGLVARMQSAGLRNQARLGAKAAATESAVQDMNAATESANSQLVPVLTATTGQQFGDNPRAWWNWWDRYNEYSSGYGGYERPVNEQRYSDSSHSYYRTPGSEVGFSRMSCFAKGTPVWTNAGLRPIDQLEMGDLVLAQNPDSAELAYKPVVSRTVRPPSATRKLSLDGEIVQTTLGHPFWVNGIGWRMAKELEDGAILHGAKGPVRISGIEPADDAQAYNLVVADFRTYFVGKHGVLVHDNTPRQPTSATVPGLIEK